MNLYLIRHGQTDWNLQKKLQGTENIPLNKTGRKQAVECAEALKDIPWYRIFTSPLSRALETGEIISHHTNHALVEIEPLLTEREFGEGSGYTHEEFHRKYKEYPSILPNGMEPFSDLCLRMQKAVSNCIEKAHGNPILLISHGGAINALLYTLSGGTIGSGITTLKNTCINILSYDFHKGISIIDYNLTPEEYGEHFSYPTFLKAASI